MTLPILPIAYLSYPITLLRDDVDHLDKIQAFEAKMRRDFVVFDPLDIKDMELLHGR